MNNNNCLFYELIHVAISTQNILSHSPSAEEWKLLYDMAKKQSLVGICFAGVQRLPENIRPPELLYLKWMGMAAKIQQRNEVANCRCVELQKQLKRDGFKSMILKGQGVASFYGEHLQGLRQIGDIDVLMWKKGLSQKENRMAVVQYAQQLDKKAVASEHHIAVDIFTDTEVEMHYAPAYLCNPFANRRLQRWVEMKRDNIHRVIIGGSEVNIPSPEFNIVFLLAHAFRHYMTEGVGLRQMMDYYFVLCTSYDNDALRYDNDNLKETLSSLNMLKFAGAMMWVIAHVFANDNDTLFLGIKPNEKLGRKLLAHIMQGGNFGHHNNKTVASKESHWGRFVNQVVHDLTLAKDYPCEALWAPLSMIREFVRIRI